MGGTGNGVRTGEPARPWLRIGFAALAVQQLALGVPAALIPHWFFTEFPFGRGWLVGTGPYNEHSVLDLGFGYVALGAVLIWAAASPGRELCRAAAFAALIGNVPHLYFHARHTDELPRVDAVVEVALLGFATLVSLLLFIAVFRRPPTRPAPTGDGPNGDGPTVTGRLVTGPPARGGRCAGGNAARSDPLRTPGTASCFQMPGYPREHSAMTRFTDRVALITGASRGIGLAIAARIVAEGGKVVITARKPEPLAEAVTELGGPTVALGIAGKADDEAHQADAVAQAVAIFGRLDVLVNNTGINPSYGPLLDLDLGAARKTLEVNVLAALGWVRAAHAGWLGAHGGAIVNVGSVAGLRPSPGIGFYGVSKAALLRLTTELAIELAPTIRVNAVAPAVVKTRFATALFEGNEEAVLTRYPLGRLGEPADVAAAVAFLAGADAAWITGQTLVLDGGNTLHGSI